MNKNTPFTIISILSIIFIISLQSVLFPYLSKIDFFSDFAFPDLGLIILIYYSINWGRISGQTIGFFTGLALDSLTGAPFGLNSLVRVILGYFLGGFKGKIYLDRYILPIVFISISIISKYILYYIVVLIFPIDYSISILSIKFLEEILLSTILTPFIFMILNKIVKKLSRDSK